MTALPIAVSFRGWIKQGLAPPSGVPMLPCSVTPAAGGSNVDPASRTIPRPLRETLMDPILRRRDFLRGAALGALAFTVGGAQVLLTPREARAQGAPFRLPKAGE